MGSVYSWSLSCLEMRTDSRVNTSSLSSPLCTRLHVLAMYHTGRSNLLPYIWHPVFWHTFNVSVSLHFFSSPFPKWLLSIKKTTGTNGLPRSIAPYTTEKYSELWDTCIKTKVTSSTGPFLIANDWLEELRAWAIWHQTHLHCCSEKYPTQRSMWRFLTQPIYHIL